jgi:hypothetical protein
MRETKITLEYGLSLHTGWQSAVADGYVVTQVRISLSLHNAALQFVVGKDGNEILAQFCKYYEFLTGREKGNGGRCGTLLGAPVFIDRYIDGNCLIIDSEG